MAENDSVQLDANGRAAKAVPKAAAISWPYPVDRRLDQLVESANDAGAGTRRNELAAALVAAASDEPDALLAMIIAFRKSAIKDVILDVSRSAAVVEIPRYRPGRRRAQS